MFWSHVGPVVRHALIIACLGVLANMNIDSAWKNTDVGLHNNAFSANPWSG